MSQLTMFSIPAKSEKPIKLNNNLPNILSIKALQLGKEKDAMILKNYLRSLKKCK